MLKEACAVTASETVKKAIGMKLSEFSEYTGESTQTLNNWFNNYPRRFNLLVKGVAFEKTQDEMLEAGVE